MEIARGLAARGHSVTVLTGLPNYPAGKIYPGYRVRPVQRERIDGIDVVRVFLYPSHSTSALGRAVNFCSFMIFSVFGAFTIGSCDALYVWHPPLTIGVSAWIIGMIKRAPIVYDVQDIWPESGIWSGMLQNRILIDLLRILEKFVYARAHHLLVVTEAARQNLMGKGVSPSKVSVVSQLIDDDLFAVSDPERVRAIQEKYGFARRFVIMFAGNIGLLQGLEAVLVAAQQLDDVPQVLFVLVGDGVDRERLLQKAEGMGLTNVLFVDRRPESDMPNFMAAADVMLLSLKYSDVCEFSIPLKTFAYMAASRPILAAIKGAAADIVVKANAGLVVPPEEPRAIADAVRLFVRMPEDERRRIGAAGRAYMTTHHSREKMLDKYVEIITLNVS